MTTPMDAARRLREREFAAERPILPIGTKTRYGRISAIGLLSGERYYWMINKQGTVSMMPDDEGFRAMLPESKSQRVTR